MNLTKFFTNEGDIAGLEINDSALRLVLLKTKKQEAPRVKFSLEEILPEGDLRGGVIKNPAGFLKSLKNLLARAKPKVKFVIVSIPADSIYAKVFSFPPGVVGEKLDSSIKLATAFQLPKEPDQIYLDWEKLADENRNLALLSLSDRTLINDLIAPMESAGLKVLAVEYHQMSLARALTLPAGQAVLVIEKSSAGHIFSIIKNKTVRFLRSLPRERLHSSLGGEAARIRDYYEIEDCPLKKIILLGNFAKEEVASLLSDKNGLEISELPAVDAVPPVAFGAALRGLIPRSDDNLISLMESGTEEAYEQKKALTFADFLTKTSLLVAAFFVLA
ncbi:MAG: pilus assembly protein PilM, partial [Candidatus Gracilibacteria bacterium]